MGLFDKKYCDVCGEKIGLFGNRKLEDANLCKKCEGKLSPWFSGRRHSSLEEIKEQLAYREENREAVKAFHTTKTFGKDMKVLVDEDAKKFMVTRSKKLEEDNPDVMDFSQVTVCDLKVNEHRLELKTKNDEGKQVSYDPPKYEYSYDFAMTIDVDHPYIDDIKFTLNTFALKTGEFQVNEAGFEQHPKSEGEPKSGIGGILTAIADAARSSVPNQEYQAYLAMAKELKDTLMGTGAEAEETLQEEEAPAPALPEADTGADTPKIAVTCPYCRALTTPNEKGCCEYCGGDLKGI